MARILIVDDDRTIRELAAESITLSGHQTFSAEDGFAALNVLRTENIDLVVSDVNMPRLDGFELLKRVRNQGNEVPFILLTARDQKADIVEGFKIGADDYISKPFGLEELSLRIMALLRRSGKIASGPSTLTCGPVRLYLEDYSVTKGDGPPIQLSRTEFRLLAELINSKGRVIDKASLLDRIWGYGYLSGATVLDTYISYLRKKLHDDNWRGIITVRGIGYKIVEDNDK